MVLSHDQLSAWAQGIQSAFESAGTDLKPYEHATARDGSLGYWFSQSTGIYVNKDDGTVWKLSWVVGAEVENEFVRTRLQKPEKIGEFVAKAYKALCVRLGKQ